MDLARRHCCRFILSGLFAVLGERLDRSRALSGRARVRVLAVASASTPQTQARPFSGPLPQQASPLLFVKHQSPLKILSILAIYPS